MFIFFIVLMIIKTLIYVCCAWSEILSKKRQIHSECSHVLIKHRYKMHNITIMETDFINLPARQVCNPQKEVWQAGLGQLIKGIRKWTIEGTMIHYICPFFLFASGHTQYMFGEFASGLDPDNITSFTHSGRENKAWDVTSLYAWHPRPQNAGSLHW